MATTEQLVTLWEAADCAYHRDCNLRWALHKPDARRRRLKAKADAAFDRMMLAIRSDLRRRFAIQCGREL